VENYIQGQWNLHLAQKEGRSDGRFKIYAFPFFLGGGTLGEEKILTNNFQKKLWNKLDTFFLVFMFVAIFGSFVMTIIRNTERYLTGGSQDFAVLFPVPVWNFNSFSLHGFPSHSVWLDFVDIAGLLCYAHILIVMAEYKRFWKIRKN
jgi:hypothetical protein